MTILTQQQQVAMLHYLRRMRDILASREATVGGQVVQTLYPLDAAKINALIRDVEPIIMDPEKAAHGRHDANGNTR